MAGVIGVICFIVSFQIKSNAALYLMQMLGSAALGVQYLLLEAYSGCIIVVIVIVRNLFLLKINDWEIVQWKGWVVIVIAISAAATAFIWEGIEDIFSFLAVAGGTIGLWTNNAQKIRLANLVCGSPSWLIYDILVHAWAGVLNEIIVLSSILISIYRFGWKNMGENTEFVKGRSEK
ncbi:MAG: YgjV family protein [Lentihominibacter sp.]